MGFIDFQYLAETARRMGSVTAGMLANEYARKKAEAERERDLANQHKYNMAEFYKKQTRQQADAMELFREQTKLKAEADKSMAQWHAEVDAFAGSPEFMGTTVAAMQSGDPYSRAAAFGRLKVVSKLRTGEDLTDADNAILNKIDDPTAQARISDLRLKKALHDADMKGKNAYSTYLEAMATAAAANQKGAFDMNDFQGLITKFTSIEGQMQDIIRDKQWVGLNRQIEKHRKNLAGRPDEEIEQAIISDPAIGLTGWNSYKSMAQGLASLQKGKDMVTAALHMGLMSSQGKGTLPPGDPTELFRSLGVALPGQEGDEGQKQEPAVTEPAPGSRPSILDQLKGKVTGTKYFQDVASAWKEGKEEPITKRLIKKYKLPAGTKIKLCKDLTEWQRWKKTAKVGDYFYLDGDLGRIVIDKKVRKAELLNSER